MIKKSFSSLLLISFILLVSTNAYAKKLQPSLGPYMTDEGSTTPKPDQTFGWDEKPYAFIQFDVGDLNTNKPLWINWIWRYDGKCPVSFEIEKITNFPEDPLNIWNSLDNWDTHKKVGEWSVRVSWRNPTRGVGSSKINFTVTPEPISSILFLAGGIALAARLRQKKRIPSFDI